MAYVSIPFNANSLGDNMLISGVTGKCLDIYAIMCQCNVLTSLTFKSSGGTPMTGLMTFTAGNGFLLDIMNNTGIPWFRTGLDEGFKVTLTGLTGGAGGIIIYEETA